MADNIFGSETIENLEDTGVTLDTLVGDGRKYRSTDDLAKAYANADSFIEKSKQRNAELEAEIKVLRDIHDARQTNTEQTRRENENRNENNPDSRVPTKTEIPDVSELVRKELASANEEKRRSDNINEAAKAMANRFGSPAKAQEAVRRRAEELGVGVEWLMESAGRSPAAFFATMGVSTTDRSTNSPSFRNEVQQIPSSGGSRNFAYWEELRKKSPKAFYSTEVQKQMFAARRELGDKFYG